MSMLPFAGSDYHKEQEAAWREREQLYAIEVLSRAAALALAHRLLRCECADGTCQACVVDRVLAEYGPPQPRPAA